MKEQRTHLNKKYKNSKKQESKPNLGLVTVFLISNIQSFNIMKQSSYRNNIFSFDGMKSIFKWPCTSTFIVIDFGLKYVFCFFYPVILAGK